MKTGTIETKIRAEKVAGRLHKINRFGAAGGTRRTGGEGGGGGGSSGGGGGRRHLSEQDEQHKLRVAMVSALLTMSVFVALFAGSYVWIAAKSPANWKPFSFPPPIWLGTLLILLSAVVYRAARTAFGAERYGRARSFFWMSLIMGGMFLAAQILTGLELSNREIRLTDNPYGIFAYVALAAGAVCVMGGLAALACLTASMKRTERPGGGLEKRKTGFQILGWYWIFTVAAWTGLFALLNLWR